MTGEPATKPAPTGPSPFGWRFTTPLLLGSTLNPINSSLLATGLVGIGLDFHKGPGTTAELISALYLCSAIMQPTMGKLATLFGPRRIFLAGALILLVGGVVGAASTRFEFLILSRVLIGAGTSAAYPSAMALVRKRAAQSGAGVPNRLLGNFAIAAQLSIVFGLPMGGILTGAFGWRALFAVNVPLALITIAFTLIGIAKDTPSENTSGNRWLLALDIPGILLFAGSIVSLLFFLSRLQQPGWWILGSSLVLMLATVIWERWVETPFIDVRMVSRNGPLQRTYLRQLLVCLGIYAGLYGTSQWMEQSAQLSASTVGLILLPLSGLSIFISRIVSRRGWVRWPLILAGLSLVMTGAVMLLITRHSSIPILIAMSMLFGFANGFGSFANQASLYVQAPADNIAVAAGLYRTAAYIGAIFSASLIELTFGTAASDTGFHILAWVISGIGIAAALLSFFDRSIPRVTK